MSRELDALVAEHVMGLRPFLEESIAKALRVTAKTIQQRTMLELMTSMEVPEYSTDIAAAWAVVEKLREDYDRVFITAHGLGDTEVLVEVELDHNKGGVPADYWEATAPTMPEAVCLAALELKGVEVPSTSNDEGVKK